MTEDETPMLELQCNLIRILDAGLKEQRIPRPKRRKMVEKFCFALSDFLDSGSIEVKGSQYNVELGLKRGQKKVGAGFPYHDYSFGSVNWYYDEGGEKEFDAKERAEEEERSQQSNVDKAGKDFPASGHQVLGDDCHLWKTETGYVFSGWLGGAYDETGEAYIWAEYFRDSKIEMRVGYKGVWGKWQKMRADKDDPEKRVARIKVKKGLVGLQYRLDGKELSAVSFKVRS
jgi:hypothetical protein